MNTAAHTLNEDSVCSDCGAEIWIYDESVDVYTYNEYGDLLRMSYYDADGNMLSGLQYEYEYDADGNKLLERCHSDGILEEETVFEAGNPLQYTYYYDDGTKSVSEYDADGNIVHSAYYDADGIVISEDWSEYAYTADGESYEARATMIDIDGSKYVSEYNEQGDQIAWIRYDADGSLKSEERYEHEYDADGDLMATKIYIDGTLSQEMLYTTIIDDFGSMRYPSTIIDYYSDGSKTVTEYDENDEIIALTNYDAEGNVV